MMHVARMCRATLLAAALGITTAAHVDREAFAFGRTARSDAGYVVVVNDQNQVVTVPRLLVSRFFLKKATRWDSGALALPVDLPADSPVREAFSRHVLSRSVNSIKAYWQQQIFSGREIPPPEKADEADALEFVRANTAAIAYVSPNATLPHGVRVLTVTD